MNIIDGEPSILLEPLFLLIEGLFWIYHKFKPEKEDLEEKARIMKLMEEKGYHFEEAKK